MKKSIFLGLTLLTITATKAFAYDFQIGNLGLFARRHRPRRGVGRKEGRGAAARGGADDGEGAVAGRA